MSHSITNKSVNEGKDGKPVVRGVSHYEYEGPIPPPQIVQGWENACPGAADRILKMAEAQSSHRHDCEKILVRKQTSNATLGLIFAFILAFVFIFGGVLVVLLGKGNILGGSLSFVGFGSVLGLFIYGKIEDRKVDKEKNKNEN